MPMIEEIEEKAYELSKTERRISPFFLMRKFKITFNCAQNICQKVWLRMHKDAKELASQLEFQGWPAQLDDCRKKNLKNLKK